MSKRNFIGLFHLFCLAMAMVEGRGIGARDDSQSGSDNLIDLVSVERTPAGTDLNKFTVRFIKNRRDVRVEVFNFRSPIPRNATESQESGGVTTLTYTLHVLNDYHVAFLASAFDRTFSQMFILENEVGESKRQDSFDTINFQIAPTGDVVYIPGTNAQFQVLLTEHTAPLDEWANPSISFHVLDITSQQFKNIHSLENVAEKSQRVLANGVNETRVTVNTAERPMTGMFDVSYSSHGQMGDLVTQVMVSRGRVLKPSTLDDIFPPAYVGFAEKEEQQCSVGKECTVSCTAVGNSLSLTRVAEIDQEGRKPVSGATQVRDPFPYTRNLVWQAPANSPRLAGQTRKFVCEAKDNVYDHWASQEMEVQYTMDSVIDEARSNVTLEIEGNMTKATLTCLVHGGYPRPNMTFNMEYQYAHFNGAAPDTIVPLGENDFLMLKVVTFDPNEGHGGYYHTPTGKLLSAICDTYQGGIYVYGSYNLPFIDNTKQAV